MSTPTTVKLPDGSEQETTLEAIIEDLANELGLVKRELSQHREMLGMVPRASSDADTGCYL